MKQLHRLIYPSMKWDNEVIGTCLSDLIGNVEERAIVEKCEGKRWVVLLGMIFEFKVVEMRWMIIVDKYVKVNSEF